MEKMLILKGKGVIPGLGEGRALVSSQPISFWGDLEPETGMIISRRHELFGKNITGKILVFPYRKGSSSGCGILLEAIRCRKAPAAIINLNTEPILALGPIVAEELYGKSLPIIILPEKSFNLLKTDDYLIVDSAKGEVKKSLE